MSPSLNPEIPAWTDAALAGTLFAIDPVGIKGINLRAQPGPARDAWLRHVQSLFPEAQPWRRIPVNIADSRLLGGLDLTATLQSGRPVAERGLLAESHGGVVLLAMAERLASGTAARLGGVIDSGEVIMERDGLTSRTPSRFGVIALDEGIHEDERTPASLCERLAFQVDLETVNHRQCQYWPYSAEMVATARLSLSKVKFDDQLLEVLCSVALALGIHSLRAPILAQRVARAMAALEGQARVED